MKTNEELRDALFNDEFDRLMKINQASHEELITLRDALLEVHESLAKVYFLGNRLYGDDFDKLVKSNNSLCNAIMKRILKNED